MTIGNFLIEYRERMKISQRTLAQRCGLSNAFISMLEKNENPRTGEPIAPSIDSLQKLAIGMGITLQELAESVDDFPVSLASGALGLPESPLSSRECDLLDTFRTLSPEGQSRLSEYAGFLKQNFQK